jgi:hypothetical protein
MGKRYRYIGAGLGVPGLPHEIDEEEAERLGLTELLKQAVQAKVYQLIPEKAKGKTAAEESD